MDTPTTAPKDTHSQGRKINVGGIWFKITNSDIDWHPRGESELLNENIYFFFCILYLLLFISTHKGQIFECVIKNFTNVIVKHSTYNCQTVCCLSNSLDIIIILTNVAKSPSHNMLHTYEGYFLSQMKKLVIMF